MRCPWSPPPQPIRDLPVYIIRLANDYPPGWCSVQASQNGVNEFHVPSAEDFRRLLQQTTGAR